MRLLFFLILLSSCQTKQIPIRKEKIYRKENDTYYKPEAPIAKDNPCYPWQEKNIGGYRRISKEFFRCKGSSLNPPVEMKIGESTSYINDCSGNHSLPLKEGQEFVYSSLLTLLNYLQKTLEKQVIITTGHRCMQHNQYADMRSYNWSSKHTVGAEVDFYVQGLEDQPMKVIETLMQYYKDQPEYKNFTRHVKKNIDVRTEPWINKEIFIKLYEADEGRDHDNLHPYPYISIQLRCDENKTKIIFDKKQAEQLRYD